MGTTAKLVRHGVYQYVRLPKELQFKGESVHVSRVKGGLLLEEIIAEAKPRK
jgi:virulence-associated protein VagC